MRLNINLSIMNLLLVFSFLFFVSSTVSAHCDGIDGPVVKAAIKSIETGNVNYVLFWVQKEDEEIVKNAFNQALVVRKLSKEAQELADKYFFETVVRLHRAGEGEPYTGLKPAGRDLGPAIPAADNSLTIKSLKPLEGVFTQPVPDEIKKLFNTAISKMNYAVDDVDAGREYVKAYVHFIHSVEVYHDTGKLPQEGHSHQEEIHQHETTKHEGGETMKLQIPESMKIEHEKLHTVLAEATKVDGEIGAAAKEVAKVLHNHFVKEEEIAIPILGLLPEISKGHVTEDMRSVITISDKLKAELPQMLEEHKLIVEALNKFKLVAEKMNRQDYVDFTEDLKLHANNEEEVTYPTAILIGEYLKLKLK